MLLELQHAIFNVVLHCCLIISLTALHTKTMITDDQILWYWPENIMFCMVGWQDIPKTLVLDSCEQTSKQKRNKPPPAWHCRVIFVSATVMEILHSCLLCYFKCVSLFKCFCDSHMFGYQYTDEWWITQDRSINGWL